MGKAAVGGEAVGGEAAMHCVRCTDAWRDREQEEWIFSCVCGRNEGATASSFEAPSGRMFECHGCSRWAHTECFADYRGLDDDALPEVMHCHRCRTPGSQSPSTKAPSPKAPRAKAAHRAGKVAKRPSPAAAGTRVGDRAKR